ncbi:MAG: branched-chain amino acid ABC transporter permease [Haloglomus sp.]
MGLLQFVIFGLEKGSFIAIATIGFSLIYSVIDMINFAYAEYMTLGGYVGFFLAVTLGMNVWVTMLGVLVFTALLGWGISRVSFTPIHETGPIPLLLTSVGVGVILRNLYRFAFGIERRFISLKFVVIPSRTFRIDAGPLNVFVTTKMLLVIGAAVVSFVGIHLLLNRTDMGIAMRATASNQDLAQLSGIRSYRIRQYTWILASGLAGLSGLLIAVVGEASPVLGLEFILVVLAAAILGGVGSIYGAFVGAYVIGLTISFAAAGFAPILEPIPVLGELLLPIGEAIAPLSTQVSFAILIVVLLLKPSGIAGTEVET